MTAVRSLPDAVGGMSIRSIGTGRPFKTERSIESVEPASYAVFKQVKETSCNCYHGASGDGLCVSSLRS